MDGKRNRITYKYWLEGSRASERAEFITDENVTADGGLTCGLPTSFRNGVCHADERPERGE